MQFLRIVTDPWVSGVLIGIGFAGLLFEMQTLGLVAGTIGALALALFFGTHAAAGLADPLVLGLALLGIAGILFELHVVPGQGLPGIFGVAALLGAIVLAFGAPFVFVAVQSLAVAIVVSILLFVAASRIVPENAFVQRLAFHDAQGADYVAGPDLRALVGRPGVAASLLRPAGVAAIDGQRVDVLTEGEFVPAGTNVVVTRVEGARVFVRPSEAA